MATAPTAADSVGVAQPADMARTTTPKMSSSGSTYATSGHQRAQPVTGSPSKGGASAGSSEVRVTM